MLTYLGHAPQVNFFGFVAQEVRMGLARLGMRSLDELVGRADLLHQKSDLHLGKTSGLDLSFLTTYAGHEPGDSTQRIKAQVPPLKPPHALLNLCLFWSP